MLLICKNYKVGTSSAVTIIGDKADKNGGIGVLVANTERATATFNNIEITNVEFKDNGAGHNAQT